MFTDNIYRHILLEFSRTLCSADSISLLNEGKSILLEKHGIIPKLDEYCHALFSAINEMTPNKNGDYIINSNIFYDIEGCPFYGVLIKIHWENTNGKLSNGMYVPSTLKKLDSNDGKLFLKMVFDIRCNKYSFRDTLEQLFVHELTHAYEDYMRLSKNKNGVNHIINNTNYGRLTNVFNDLSDLRNICSSIAYYLSKVESNAYVTTIVAQMKPHIKDCSDSKDVMNVLKRTQVYATIKKIEEELHLLLNAHDDEKDIILKFWNEATKDNFRSYNQLRRVLKNKYLKNVYHLMTQVSKSVYDLWNEYGSKNTIPNQI